jgi:hypothetical protein
MTAAPPPPPFDPIEALARDDKWYLGCADGILFAPPFPVWLDSPGFWDEATVYQYSIGPLFTVSLLDHEGRELPLRPTSRRWTPADLTVEYAAPHGITAIETRSVHPGGIFASEWRLASPSAESLHLVAWTAQQAAALDFQQVEWNGSLSFTRTLTDRRDVSLDVRAELAVVGEASSWSASLSEGSALHPHWRLAPFGEQWRAEGLPRRVRLEGISNTGVVYAAVHRALPKLARESSAAFAMRLSLADRSLLHGRRPIDTPRRTSPPLAQAAIAHTVAGGGTTLGGVSRRRWSELFGAAPMFRCSDPYLERYYWYRWYGLWLNAIAPGAGNYDAPTMCEGIAYFHQPITYSGQCHVRELRWLHDPLWAQGVLRTFFGHQKPDGSLHGRIYLNHLQGTDFYHANWGDAVLALDAISPDEDFLAELYPALARHSDWLATSRDAEDSGMIDVVDQYETGQEYMSRYQAVDARADAYGWENRIRLKGIDVTVYAYALARALERLAPRAGKPGDSARWRARADRIARAVRERMWSEEDGMFSDVNPATGERTGVAAAVCFYPYFTDLATVEHLQGLERNLLNPSRFWTSYPVPSSALDDPFFNAEAEWKGKRHVCPWNGRVWPMTNSHLVEALGRWAAPDRPVLREALVRLLGQFVRMMFHDGELQRPNCFEHYNPFTGAASTYRGIDDYQHSWVADLILQYVAGIRPKAESVTVDPFPFGLEFVEATGIIVRGRTITVRVEGNSFHVDIDGVLRSSTLGSPIEIAT